MLSQFLHSALAAVTAPAVAAAQAPAPRLPRRLRPHRRRRSAERLAHAERRRHPAGASSARTTARRSTARPINQVSQRESEQIVAAVAIRIPPDTKKPVLMVQLPLGIQVTEQVTVQVDEGKAERYPIQTCAQNGCFVAATGRATHVIGSAARRQEPEGRVPER